jgi:metal-sulfur cluster biosynthetic enzyme
MIDDSPEAFERLRQSLAATRLEHRALTRNCRAVRVPSGEEAELECDDEVTLIRETSGAYIVQVPVLGGEYRIDSDDADALGKARPLDECTGSDAGLSNDGTSLDARIRARLAEVYDPELPVNIVDLGLIYATQAIELAPDRYRVEVEMTLTTPQCGMGRMIARDIERSVSALAEVAEVETRIVWEPEWTPHKISPEGRTKLGID